MVLKRKAVAKSASGPFARSKKSRAEEEKKAADVPEDEEWEDEEDEEEEAEEWENEEEAIARSEEELTAARRKELRSTPAADLKELAASRGLDGAGGKKWGVVEAILAQEAGARAAERAREARVRGVLVGKKEELEGLSLPELRELCASAGVRGILTKRARVELLIKRWHDDDGVDKALAKQDRDAREAELASMDRAALQGLCEQAGVDPLVPDVMADRVLRREHELGRFAAPEVEEEGADAPAQAAPTPGGNAGAVEALLASETSRKKVKELRKQAEDAAASKRKEFRAMSVEDLRNLLASKGCEAAGKKENLVEAMLAVSAQEEVEAAKRARLRSLAPEDLRQRAARCGLEVGKRDAMVAALLKHEAKTKELARAYEAKVGEVLEKKREELEAQTGAALKEACASRGLKIGVCKQDRVETLLEDARASGEVGKLVAKMAREERRRELLGAGGAHMRELCGSLGVDPLVKEVMVERVMAHEDEFGRIEREVDGKPAAKRAKASKK